MPGKFCSNGCRFTYEGNYEDETDKSITVTSAHDRDGKLIDSDRAFGSLEEATKYYNGL